MSNEQKLLHVALEAINALMMGAERYSDNHWGRICMPTDSAMSKGADAAMAIRQALATTEPEPTGMPELPEPDLLIDADLDSDAPYRACSVDLMRAYGEQCWKAGYKHGAWGDKPAVNQQLTTEPVDEREAFANYTKDALMAGRAYAQEALIRFDDAYDRHPSTEPERNAILTDIQLIDAAMAKGVKG